MDKSIHQLKDRILGSNHTSPAGSERRNGTAVILGDDEHACAPYTRSRDNAPTLGTMSRIDSSSLKEMSRKGGGMSLCFSPRSLYADVGDFSCVSPEAATAHIRSSIDKIGLFREDYRISFIKIKDVDAVRSKYSYLAIPSSELDRAALLDEQEAMVDMFCPIEASLAAAVAATDPGTAVIIYQDTRFIRIIGAKAGIIYYLITVNSAESFDAEADTISGIREMSSLLMNTHQEKVGKVYTVGQGDVKLSGLDRYGIATEPYRPGESPDADPEAIVLLGTVMHPGYDFTPEKLGNIKQIAAYSKYSMAASLAMMLVSAVLLLSGWNNARQADGFKRETNAAIHKNALELKELEQDYVSLSKNLDITRLNGVINLYKEYEAEPRFHTIVEAVSAKVPENVFLTRIEVSRPASQDAASPEASPPAQAAPGHAAKAGSFCILIEGVINSAYPQSKGIFSSFTDAVQEMYPVKNAAFSHKESSARFSLNCEMKI